MCDGEIPMFDGKIPILYDGLTTHDLSKCPCSDGFSYAKNGEIPSSGPK